MSKLKVRKFWKIIFSPLNLFAAIVVWLVFDVTWEQASRGEL